MNKKFEYIEADKIHSIYDFSQIQDNLYRIISLFIKYKHEIIYIQKEENIYGCISTGDVIRAVHFESNPVINTNFYFMEEIRDEDACDFFNEHPTIHEIPIIRNKKITGIITDGKRKTASDWRIFIQALYGDSESEFEKKMISSFLKCTDAHVCLYDVDTGRLIEKLMSQYSSSYIKKTSYISKPISIKVTKMSNREQRKFWGKYYYEGIGNSYIKCRDELIVNIKNGAYHIHDIKNEFFTFKDGYRETSNANKNASNRIYLFGPCYVLGAFVCDDCTISAFLQDRINNAGYTNYQVINVGMFGPSGSLARLFTEPLAKDDIAIVFTAYPLSEELKKDKAYRGDISNLWLSFRNPVENFFDYFSHCNYKVLSNIANHVYDDLSTIGLFCYEKDDKLPADRKPIQDYFINKNVYRYFSKYFIKNNLYKGSSSACVK